MGLFPLAEIRLASYSFSPKAEGLTTSFAENDGVVQNKLVALRKILKKL